MGGTITKDAGTRRRDDAENVCLNPGASALPSFAMLTDDTQPGIFLREQNHVSQDQSRCDRVR